MRPQARAILIMLPLLGGCVNSEPLPEQCYVKPESGKCRAAHTRYYFDTEEQACKAFIWGGCQGVVPFDTLEACQSVCGDAEGAGGGKEGADTP